MRGPTVFTDTIRISVESRLGDRIWYKCTFYSTTISEAVSDSKPVLTGENVFEIWVLVLTNFHHYHNFLTLSTKLNLQWIRLKSIKCKCFQWCVSHFIKLRSKYVLVFYTQASLINFRGGDPDFRLSEAEPKIWYKEYHSSYYSTYVVINTNDTWLWNNDTFRRRSKINGRIN
jgi:hypothetical protein